MSVNFGLGSFLQRIDHKISNQSSGFWLAIGANAIWGTTFLASKYTLQSWGPLTASALRFAIALVSMLAIFPLLNMKLRLPKNRREIFGLLSVSVTGFGFLYPLQLSGLKFISSGLSASLMLTSPLFVLGLGALFLKERISSRKVIALILGILGGIILILPNTNDFAMGAPFITGSLLTLLAAASLALSVIATRASSLIFDAANLTFWPMLFGFILIVPFAIVETNARPSVAPTGIAFFALLYLSIVCSAFCFLLWNRAIAKSSPREIATTMHLKTPVAVIVGAAFAGESLTLSIFLGAAIVAFGVWLSQSSEKRKAKKRKVFTPDLIAEVTSVCDRQCPGCYAPNFVTKDSPESVRRSNPGVFISASVFREALENVVAQNGSRISTLSLRGGEPSMHPEISQLVAITAEFAQEVYLETHGLWIDMQSLTSQTILESCAKFGAKLKVSFDRMHGLDVSRLRRILKAVELSGVQYLVAITEQTEEEYLRVRNLLPELADDSFVFQKRSTTEAGLILPRIGVLRIDGTLKASLSVRESFRSRSRNFVSKGYTA